MFNQQNSQVPANKPEVPNNEPYQHPEPYKKQPVAGNNEHPPRPFVEMNQPYQPQAGQMSGIQHIKLQPPNQGHAFVNNQSQTPPLVLPQQVQPRSQNSGLNSWNRQELNSYGTKTFQEKQTSRQFDQQLRQYVELLFKKYDKDGSGALDIKESHQLFNEVLANYGIGVVLQPSETEALLYQIDRDNNGSISFPQLFQQLRNFILNEGRSSDEL